jgi:uncharacterized protein
MFTSMALVGCGSSSSGTNPQDGVIAVTGGVTAVTCTGNTPINTAYGCLPIYSCTGGTGWLAGEARCVAPIAGGTGAQSSGNFVTVSGLSILSRSTIELFLQNAGLCSPAPYGVWYFGAADCGAYSHAGYMVLQTTGATGQTIPAQGVVVVGAGAAAPNQYNNSGWTSNVLRRSFYSALAPANNNQGFTGTGPNGFRFVVNSGFPGSSYQMSVDLQYNGTVFARGTLLAQ